MIDQLLALPIEQKIGQLFFIGIPGPSLDDPTKDLFDEITPGGVCLFARNIREAGQTRMLLDGIRAQLPTTPFLSLDQEGGLVDRMRRIMTPMPAANKIKNLTQSSEIGELIAETIRILGFNMDFAPVVDIIDGKRAAFSNGLHSRAFGSSKQDVVTLAGAFITALRRGGCLTSLKHFPGLGASRVDSHEELPRVDIATDELYGNDLLPYREFIRNDIVDSIMVAHAAFPMVDLQETDRDGKLLPSSLSHNFITSLLREELGYDGLVLTDDLEMGAIIKNYGIGEACKMAILAGEDMLSICADPARIRAGYRAVLDAFEADDLPENRINDSLRRIAALKLRASNPLPFDLSRLENLSKRIAEFNHRLDRN